MGLLGVTELLQGQAARVLGSTGPDPEVPNEQVARILKDLFGDRPIGRGHISLDMPAVVPHGVNLYAQYLGRDVLANTAQIISSDLLQVNLVAPWSTVSVSSVHHDEVARRATTHRNAGYVVRFD